MWAAGIRYRKQYSKLPGRPDFVIVRARVAIFCDSSFWHGRGWPEAAEQIKSNKEFWIKKIEGNIIRDQAVNDALKSLGWKVLRFWDFQILGKTSKCVDRVVKTVQKRVSRGFNDKNSSNRLLLRRGGHDARSNPGWLPRVSRNR